MIDSGPNIKEGLHVCYLNIKIEVKPNLTSQATEAWESGTKLEIVQFCQKWIKQPKQCLNTLLTLDGILRNKIDYILRRQN